MVIGLSFTPKASAVTATVNVDFGSGALYVGQGAMTDSGTLWNAGVATNGTGTNLLDSQGIPSSVGYTLAGAQGRGNVNEGGELTSKANLLGDYIFGLDNNPASHLDLLITGLVPNSPYDIVLYGIQNNTFNGFLTDNRGSTFTVGGVQKTSTGTNVGLSDAFVEGQTHVTYLNVLADGQGQIDIDVTPFTQPGDAGFPLALLNGFQIQGEALGVPMLEIDRETGAMTFLSGPSLTLSGYSITSPNGALQPSEWLSVTDHHDMDSGGGFDDQSNWVTFTQTPYDLSEGTLETTTFGPSSSLNLGNAWIPSPVEDIFFEILLEDGTTLTPHIRFTGNNGQSLEVGDLDAANGIDAADWAIFAANFGTDLSGLSPVQRYRQGDLNLDGVSDGTDFRIFKSAYNAVHGAGAFAAMTSQVPEPATLALLGVAALLGIQTRRSSGRRSTSVVVALTLVATFVVSTSVQAVLVNRWTFDEGGANLGFDSIGGAHAVVVGNATQGAPAPGLGSTGSLSLNGDGDFLRISGAGDHFNTLDAGGVGWSVAAWVQTTGTEGDVMRIVSTDRPTSDIRGWGVGMREDLGSEQFIATAYGVIDMNGSGAAAVMDGQWHHVAYVFRNNGGRFSADFYADGLPVSSVSTGSAFGIIDAQSGFNIGSQALPEFEQFFNGLIDNLEIYDHELSDVEVLNLVPDPQVLTLEVNTISGRVLLKNNSSTTFNADFYQISSEGGALNPAGWASIGSTGQNGLPMSDGSGNGWQELGVPSNKLLAEAYLQGMSPLNPTDSIDLGFAYDPSLFGSGNDGDLLLTFQMEDGRTLPGLVTYITGSNLPGDYNGDGIVDLADYTVWRNNLGATDESSLNNNGDGGGVSISDYQFWKSRFGNTSQGGNLALATVPEPSTYALLLVALLGVALLTRRPLSPVVARVSMTTPAKLPSTLLLIVAWVVVGSTTQAAVTNDRLFQMGEGAAGAGGSVPENGVAGNIVGSGVSNPAAGDTVDSSGPSGAYLGLIQSGNPQYVNVHTGPYARPGTSLGHVGIRFDGVDDLLQGLPLNRPDELDTLVPGYPINYDNITTRGLQGWVYPSQAGIDSGTFQSLIFDTNRSGGPAINEAGQWTQTNASHGVPGQPVPASVPVVGDTWYHVMHHVYHLNDPHGPRVVAGTGTPRPVTSVLYVDGIAVSANNDAIDLGIDPLFTGKLVIGASELAGDGVNPVYGNYFQGVIDNVDMYVYGNNETGTPGVLSDGEDWGTFDLFADNEWIRTTIDNHPLLSGTLLPGDINLDGVVSGDGTGPAASDDVSAFVAGWGSVKLLQGAHNVVTVGDWSTWANGDLNHDGVTNLLDWHILRTNHPNPAALNLAGLLDSSNVPEPSAVVWATLLVTCLSVHRLARR